MGSTISPFPTTRRRSSLSLHHGSSDQRSVEVEGKGLDLGEGSKPLMHYRRRRLNRSVPSVGEEKEERINCNNNFHCTRRSYVRRAKDKALKNKFRKRDGDGDKVRDEAPTHIGTKNDILPDQIESESRCTRVNGRGWRCQRLAYYGFSLCSHHQLGGRIRNAERVRMRRIGLDAAEVFGKRKKNKNKM
ncbi:hypothetical protein QJS04_geneDACA017496 [Acorus gramineus]|uniref:WRC domain-containing protein n=1 Tax=Acorus gramineus TaxID=55184 RepID=A0AAV9AI55_ACOGR|nr:hypothetical protein QJS04_geneDACA017496 [Acorus gramineus]